MSGRVLIDTSVWIDFFRGKDAGLTEQIAVLLKSGRAVYTGIIAIELLNGAKGQKELEVLYDAFDAMERINEGETTYINAGKMGYEISKKGYRLSVVDLLIAQVAMENDTALMTFDEHFKVIAKNSKLNLFRGEGW